MKFLHHTLLIILVGSTLSADSWYSPYLQKIRSYFNPTALSYATIGTAAGAYAAHRADLNPCVGAACGLLLGLSAEKLKNMYAPYSKSEQTQLTPQSSNVPNSAKLPVTPTIHKTKKQYTQLSEIPIVQTKIHHPEKFNSDYAKIKQAVFDKMDFQFAKEFNQKYPEPTVYAVIELAAHFDDMSKWQESYPPLMYVTIGSQKEIPITDDLGLMLYEYKNGKAVRLYREILAQQNPKKETLQTSIAPAAQLSLENPQKFNSAYETIKQAIFHKMGQDYENDFQNQYSEATVAAIIELASHFDAIPRWSETWPVSGITTIDGQKISLSGDIANIIYDNENAIITLKQSYLE